jgi:carbamoyltransferase|tara:strand:+ start:2256 stop:4076 length:1821 start_codon:yes stop_codon:yes gene_type:complete
MSRPDFWILGISRGHNAGVCLVKNGEIVFSIEEERLSRNKYDGSPLAAMTKVLEYTDKVDYMFMAHTTSIEAAGKIEFTGDNIYTGMARKLGLIDQRIEPQNHPQVIDLSHQHHKLHSACSFYRSGFDSAVSLVIDGCGSVQDIEYNYEPKHRPDSMWEMSMWEVESIIDCSYPSTFKTLYKHSACKDTILTNIDHNASSEHLGEEGTHIAVHSGSAGITKTYEAATKYAGFQEIEAGKTMGLFPYGEPNKNIPPFFVEHGDGVMLSDRNMFVSFYPRGALVNAKAYPELDTNHDQQGDLSLLQNRRDLAYAAQQETQEQVYNLILKAVKLSGKTQVVFSGGYALNCVANYFLLDRLRDKGIELFVEPISNDGGTSIGAALLGHYMLTEDIRKNNGRDIYMGPPRSYSSNEITEAANKYNATIEDADNQRVIDLMTNKHIVACFQGRSEAGPRALGNRSLMFDPTFEDGKDFVNEIKRREYFRPFAGSILAEDAHEWFDLRGMEDSPHMMYAVNCQPGIAEKIPAIIHVDGTCRIQTVTHEQNPHYYDIIKAFKEKTGCPIIFNTSFNLGGEPLVETLTDALHTLAYSKIEYLYLPEYNKLLTVNN